MTNSKSEKKVPFMLYVKTLLKSVRQYKKETFLTMLFWGAKGYVCCSVLIINGWYEIHLLTKSNVC